MEKSISTLQKNYLELNNSFKKELVFYVGLSSGFFSEYNNMILSMLYCLNHEIKFKLCSKNANFDERNGWSGFFLPFCEEVDSDKSKHWRSRSFVGSILAYIQNKDNPKRRLENLSLYLKPISQHALTQEIFGRSRNKLLYKFQRYNIPQLDINGDIQQACSQLVRLTWRFNESTEVEIKNMIKAIDLPKEYIAFHIRRGDKFVEHQFEPVEKYFKKLGNVKIKNLFVLTDDYRIIEYLISNHSEWNIYTLCGKEECGYFQPEIDGQSYNQKRDNILKLIASVEIMSFSKKFIGVFSSNPDMFLGIRNPSICSGVDYDKWKLW